MSESKRPLKVFLCHASTDKPKVRELYRYLKKRGIQPWFDEEDLVGGQDWQIEIPKALATSDAIIICLTKNSVDKEGYIQKEIKFALDKALEMPEGRIFLIPVKFEECDVPFSLSRYQWVDLTIESGYAKMMKALKFRASQLERSTVEVSKKNNEEEKLARAKRAQGINELENPEERSKTYSSGAIVTEINSIGDDFDGAQPIPDFLLPKALENEIAKVPLGKSNPENVEILKPKAVGTTQVNELVKKTSRAKPKSIEPQIARLKSGVQIAYWFGGFIVLVLGIILLSSLNNLPSMLQPTPEITQTQVIATLSQNTVEPSATATSTSISTPANTLTPTPLPAEITDAKGVSMALVPAGAFTMGSVELYRVGPAHTVYLDVFYIDKYEVSNAEYAKCVVESDCLPPQQMNSLDVKEYYGNPDYDSYPVIYVNWDMANSYCTWRGKKDNKNVRLPTEAEWEKSARSTDERRYPWGDSKFVLGGNFCDMRCPSSWDADMDDGYRELAPVSSFSKGVSPYGIYNMAGNTWEWVADWYVAYEKEYSNVLSNPLGPQSGTDRVVRGGSWKSLIFQMETTYRTAFDPLTSDNNLGFRCAMDAP